jgi:hypothetical protein
MRSAIAIFVLVLVLGPSAGARESDYDVSIQEDLDSELAKEKMFDVPVYFHDQPHPKVAKNLTVERVNSHTRGLFRSDRTGCRVAFISALRELQVKAQRQGADAVVGIKSVTRHKELESATQYRCVAGTTVVHVGLEGTTVKFAE